MTPLESAVISVTTHALHRWRERHAAHADDTVDVVAAAVRAARLLDARDPLPHGALRRPGTAYAVGAGGALFVLDPVACGRFRVVTVLTGRVSDPAPVTNGHGTPVSPFAVYGRSKGRRRARRAWAG